MQRRFVGGADGRYRYVDEYDLRPYSEPDHSQFIMQGIHSTLVHHYNDTLNFLVISADNKTSTVHVSKTYSELVVILPPASTRRLSPFLK